MIRTLRELEFERKSLRLQAAVQRIAIANDCESIAARLSPAEGVAVLARPALLATIAGLLIWAARRRSRRWLAKAVILIGLWRRVASLFQPIKK